MKRFIFIGLVMSLLSACSNNLLNAEPPKQALNGAEQEVRSYSLLHGVSTAEANKALFLEANRDSALDAIEKEFTGRISGIYVENSPTYKVVVRVKGYGHNEKRNIVVGNAISKGDLPIDIQYGAKETRDVAKEQLNKATKLANKYFSKVQTIGYDEKSGIIYVHVNGKQTTENQRKIEQFKAAWNNPNLPLEIHLVNWSVKPLVDTNSGALTFKR